MAINLQGLTFINYLTFCRIDGPQQDIEASDGVVFTDEEWYPFKQWWCPTIEDW